MLYMTKGINQSSDLNLVLCRRNLAKLLYPLYFSAARILNSSEVINFVFYIQTYYPQAIKSHICIEVADFFLPPICCLVPEKVWESCIGPKTLSEMNKSHIDTHRQLIMSVLGQPWWAPIMPLCSDWIHDTSQIITSHSINFTITAHCIDDFNMMRIYGKKVPDNVR